MGNRELSISYADISLMLGFALFVLWLWLRDRNVLTLLSRATLSLSGYLRPRPDQAMERALRTAFAQLDEELALVLGDRPIAGPCP